MSELTDPYKHVTMVLPDIYKHVNWKKRDTNMLSENTLDIKAVNTIRVLNETIEHFKTKIRPTATGHIHTTINALEERVKELSEKLFTKNVTGTYHTHPENCLCEDCRPSIC